jgi:hypothetical protein
MRRVQNETGPPASIMVPAEDVDWTRFPSRRPPGRVPDLLRAAGAADPDIRTTAADGLRDLAVHQTTTYEVAAVIAPYLVEIVRGRGCAVLLELLEEFRAGAGHDLETSWRSWAEFEAVGVEQLRGEVRAWLGSTTPLRPPTGGTDLQAGIRWALQAYEAVRAGLPVYLAALDDPDPAVRGAAADLLAALGEDTATVLLALTRRVQIEADEAALARVLMAVAACADTADPDAAAAVLARLDHPSALVRATATIAAAPLAVLPVELLTTQLYAIALHTVAVVPCDAWPDPPENLSFPASTALSSLGAHTAPQRLAELLRKLADPVEPVDAYWAVWELAKAAFPRENEPMPPFAELLPEQQQAVRAMRPFLLRCDLHGWPPITRHNVPGRLLDFDAWCLGR